VLPKQTGKNQSIGASMMMTDACGWMMDAYASVAISMEKDVQRRTAKRKEKKDQDEEQGNTK
jgi:hypothetical protein